MTFLVWRLRTGACGLGSCGFCRHRMPPEFHIFLSTLTSLLNISSEIRLFKPKTHPFEASPSLDRDSVASPCMDIHINLWISKRTSIKAWIIEDSSIKAWLSIHGSTDIHWRIPFAQILMWISTLVWIIEDWHLKIMDILMDNRRILDIRVWIYYGFSDQGRHGQLLV